jgi:hypothetical protein
MNVIIQRILHTRCYGVFPETGFSDITVIHAHFFVYIDDFSWIIRFCIDFFVPLPNNKNQTKYLQIKQLREVRQLTQIRLVSAS